MRRILPSITTLSTAGSTWSEKIVELARLGLHEAALFLTGLNEKERDDCYRELETLRKSHSFTVPFVHAVNSMTAEEFEYLVASFGTSHFNLHPQRCWPLRYSLGPELKKMIYIENSTPDGCLETGDLAEFAGVCLDVAHLEDLRLGNPAAFVKMQQIISCYPIGVNHISAVRRFPEGRGGRRCWSSHTFTSLKEFDYLRGYSPAYFGQCCAIELENPLSEQLEVCSLLAAYLGNERLRSAA